MKTLSWYPMDVDRWNSSRRIGLMTFEEQGIYLAMLNQCWSNANCDLPNDAEEIACLLRGRKTETTIQSIKSVIEKCFVVSDVDPSSIVNPELLAVFIEQKAKYERRKNAGKLSKQCSSNAQALPEQSPARASVSVSGSGSKNNKKELSDAEEVPRWAGCEHFRMDAKGYQKVLKAYVAQGLCPADVGIAIAEVDRWLDSEDAKPRKARARKTSHHRFLNATWVLDNLARRKKALAAQAPPPPSRRPELRSVNGNEKRLLKTVGLGG